uniref:Transferrin receptor protein 2-like n=1 Tax=Callorhinchus milii TaxID=7868 RepID=A0A4W3GN65_CALMI|eukprot:gi/632991257/ref/XP_007884545.1/ PREDICTED: transferrin receptor protein 2-like [Callorhinchus milii]
MEVSLTVLFLLLRIEPLTMESTTYPFIAFAGVPAMELSFNENNQKYLFLNTKLDTFDALNKKLNLRLSEFSKTVAETIGLMAIKLSHENLLSLDFKVYSDEMLKYLIRLETFSEELQVPNSPPHPDHPVRTPSPALKPTPCL